MKHFYVLVSFLVVVIKTTQSLSVYEQWLRDTEAAAAATANPKSLPVQPKVQQRQQFVFPTKKQSPGIRPLRPVVVPVPIAAKPVGQKSQEKCTEYAKLSVETHKVSGFALDSDEDEQDSVLDINVEKCDISSGFIVGGKAAKEREFPHMAALGYADRRGKIQFKCGASLISERFCLTAAHCKHDESSSASVVRLGALNLDQSPATDYQIESFITHHGYDSESKQNDIALVKLQRDVKFNEPLKIRPACLWTNTNINQPKVIATGWGYTQYSGDSSKDLMKVPLDILPTSKCIDSFEDQDEIVINGNQICAGVLAGGKDTCQGDSGGPIQIASSDNKCVSFIVGITSFGGVCGFRNSPAVYTRVSAYIGWIEANVWK